MQFLVGKIIKKINLKTGFPNRKTGFRFSNRKPVFH